MGSDDQVIFAGTLQELAEHDIGPPLHSVVLVGRDVHDLELEFLRAYAVNLENFDRVAKTYLEK